MANKKTKKDFYAELRVLAEGNDELIAFIDHEVDLLTKKSTNKTPTKVQKENEAIKNAIVEALAEIGEAVTVTELLAKTPSLSEMVNGSNQKTSALLKQLSDPELGDCRVVKLIDKKRSLFKVAE